MGRIFIESNRKFIDLLLMVFAVQCATSIPALAEETLKYSDIKWAAREYRASMRQPEFCESIEPRIVNYGMGPALELNGRLLMPGVRGTTRDVSEAGCKSTQEVSWTLRDKSLVLSRFVRRKCRGRRAFFEFEDVTLEAHSARYTTSSHPEGMVVEQTECRFRAVRPRP